MASKNFFLSYARVDIAFATKIANDLLAEGVDIWVDHLDIEKGKDYDIEIENALTDAKCIVVLLSSTSVKNRNVRNEIELALEDDKELIPLLMESCKPPLSVIRKQRIDFTADYDVALNELLKALDFPERTIVKVAASPLIDNLLDEPLILDQKIDSPLENIQEKLQHKFNTDVFISYAALDDEQAMDGEIGWVTNFHKTLEKRLNQILGYQVKVWRNSILSLTSGFLSDIENQNSILQNTKVFIPILTPRYVKSKWCGEEFETFVNGTEKTGGLFLDHKSRIFTVYKTPVVRNELPEELQLNPGYYFFENNSDRVVEFGVENLQAFYDKLTVLAYEIADMLRLLDPK